MMLVAASRRARRLTLAAAGAGVLLLALLGAAPALATPWWRLDSGTAPTLLPPGDKEGRIVAVASNLGGTPVPGEEHPFTITDRLPPGLVATHVSGKAGPTGNFGVMTCSTPLPAETVSCGLAKPIPPYIRVEVEIIVEVKAPEGTYHNEVEVQGGGLPNASLSRPLTVKGGATPFGIEAFEMAAEDEGGVANTQAGSHPAQLTTTINFNQTIAPDGNFGIQRSVPALARNLTIHLPPGLIGNPTAVPQCSNLDFTVFGINNINACAPDTVIGVAELILNEPVNLGVNRLAVPVFNLVPAFGEPARIGFEALSVPVILDTSVRTGSDYGVDVKVKNASQVTQILSSQVTIWGVPGDPLHDQARGWPCIEEGAWVEHHIPCTAPKERSSAPYLTMPTSCAGPLATTLDAESWPSAEAPAGARAPQQQSLIQPLVGCDALPFDPSINVEPETQAGSTPTGMTVGVEVPQQSLLSPTELVQADVKDTTVALPEGLQLNPGAADGLLTCSAGQVGFIGGEERLQTNNIEFSPGAPECPERAKVGTVRIKTPLLSHELEGGIYLAVQNTNPFAPPLVLYIIASDPASGVLVKLAGTVTPNAVTGQLVSTFEHTPPVPFEELKLHFFEGGRASVTTPQLCGNYTTTSSFTPWSGGEPASPSASFTVSSGPNGAACPSNPPPFTPGLQAGSLSLQAGGFTEFGVTINRPDGDQALEAINMHLPTGLAAMISSVTPCAEARVLTNTCGPESLIGHTTASSGLGGNPVTLGGELYLTGPYRGAPFGLLAVTHAAAGPFDLGDVLVRSTISVDPYSAAVTIASDPLPAILKGVPAQVKQLNVTVDRHNFQFNPTSCNRLSITGTLTGYQGTAASVSSPFQVANCAALPFHPTFSARTEAKTSKANGASLRIRVTSGSGQANIAKTKVSLPIALPSRLTTIQKACIDKVFEANPESCPEGSNIGTAIIHTPVFSNPLKGPAYLVSHGSAAFPDVEFVLKGEGLTIILDGKTDIKKGITTSAFELLPDAPFTEFETVLPEGPHSALAANGSLCTQKLEMPTTLTAQNGIVIKQNTKIAVSGCPKALTTKQKLAKALKACRHKYRHAKKKRVACERKARSKYKAKRSVAHHKG